MKPILLIISMTLASAAWTVLADSNVATLRQGTDLKQEAKPATMARPKNDDVRKQRSYPMQPPVIPHSIIGYQVDTFVNKCLSCHSRKRAQESQAPMISVTHYMDREGNFLADVSPRRYFCNQCHVSQLDVKPIVDNNFVDVDHIIQDSEKK